MLKETNDVENTYEIITSVTLSNFTHITYVHPLICFFCVWSIGKSVNPIFGVFFMRLIGKKWHKTGTQPTDMEGDQPENHLKRRVSVAKMGMFFWKREF